MRDDRRDERRLRHGSESFSIEGEGVVGESGGGRVVAPLRRAAAGAPPFRFSRIGPKSTPLSVQNMTKIARGMIQTGGGTTGVPGGYTYIGQFIDHDLTFDKTIVELGEDVSPADLLQGRSPTLDLDSLYGAGPGDPASAGFYSDGLHLATGETVRIGPDKAQTGGFDLPRLGTGGRRNKIRPNVPDERNDENLAVAQHHAAMIRFHNRVVDKQPGALSPARRFRNARREVVKHYQWMIRHDYLPRICDPAVVDDVFTHGRKVFEVAADPTSMPTMPIEFSVGAFRLGHSMIRDAYSWNKNFNKGEGSLFFLFDFTATSGGLGSELHLPSNWILDWRRMYDFAGEAGRADLSAPPNQFNRAMRIDTQLVDLLANLPTGSFGGPEVPFDDPKANLAFRNLERAAMLRLATGQQMADLLKSKGVRPLKKLSQSQILGANADLSALTAVERNSLATRTPLWFYILREAERNDGVLTGVGARLVAETIHRAMEGSRFSIVRDPDWRPRLGPDTATFRMVDLLLFAFEGKKKLLNPLGDT